MGMVTYHDLGMGDWLGFETRARGACMIFSEAMCCKYALVFQIAGIAKYLAIVYFSGSRRVFHS